MLFSAMNYDISLSLYQRHLSFLPQWRHNLKNILTSVRIEPMNAECTPSSATSDAVNHYTTDASPKKDSQVADITKPDAAVHSLKGFYTESTAMVWFHCTCYIHRFNHREISLFIAENSIAYRTLIRSVLQRLEGAQWLSGRVLDWRLRGRGFQPHRGHCVVSLSKNINLSLVLVQPRKTCPFINESLLMECKESNQANKNCSVWLRYICYLNILFGDSSVV